MKQQRKQEIINSLKMCTDLSGEDLNKYFESLRQIGKRFAKNKELKELEKVIKILGNDTRLIILKLLNQKHYCVCELEVVLGKSQSSISHHLKLLENARLIRGIKEGYFTHYEIIAENFKNILSCLYKQYPFIKD